MNNKFSPSKNCTTTWIFPVSSIFREEAIQILTDKKEEGLLIFTTLGRTVEILAKILLRVDYHL